MARFQIEGKWYEANSYKEAREIAKGGGQAVVAKPPIGAPPKVAGPAPVIAPPVVVAPVVVVPPAPVQPAAALVVAAAAVADDGEIKVVHRADSRDLDHASIKRDKGFACQSGQWCIRELACARTFIKKLINPALDTT